MNSYWTYALAAGAILLATCLAASAQPVVTIDGNSYLLNVDTVEMSSRRVFDCEDPQFISTDYDKSGRDSECWSKGGERLNYDPCTHASYATALMRRNMSGIGCLSKAEHDAEPVDLCDGFSPVPQGC